MLDTPLEICNAVFREHNRAFRIKSIELSARHVPRNQRQFLCNQMKIDLGRKFDVTYNSNRYRIVCLPIHRPAA